MEPPELRPEEILKIIGNRVWEINAVLDTFLKLGIVVVVLLTLILWRVW